MNFKFRLVESFNSSDEKLHYDSLDITVHGKLIDDDYYQPPYYEEHDITIEYDYVIDRVSVEECLTDILLRKHPNIYKNWDDEKLNKYIADNYRSLLKTYYKDVLDAFEDDAREEASYNYEYDEDEEYDTSDDRYDSQRDDQYWN